jgi:hypothetical protein
LMVVVFRDYRRFEIDSFPRKMKNMFLKQTHCAKNTRALMFQLNLTLFSCQTHHPP